MPYVVVSERDGVILGVSLGLVFGTKCDTVGQTHSCVLDSEDEAQSFIDFLCSEADMDGGDLSYVQVVSGHWRDLKSAGLHIGDMAFNEQEIAQ